MIGKNILPTSLGAIVTFIIFFTFLGVWIVYDIKEILIVLFFTGSLCFIFTIWTIAKCLGGGCDD